MFLSFALTHLPSFSVDYEILKGLYLWIQKSCAEIKNNVIKAFASNSATIKIIYYVYKSVTFACTSVRQEMHNINHNCDQNTRRPVGRASARIAESPGFKCQVGQLFSALLVIMIVGLPDYWLRSMASPLIEDTLFRFTITS